MCVCVFFPPKSHWSQSQNNASGVTEPSLRRRGGLRGRDGRRSVRLPYEIDKRVRNRSRLRRDGGLSRRVGRDGMRWRAEVQTRRDGVRQAEEMRKKDRVVRRGDRLRRRRRPGREVLQ